MKLNVITAITAFVIGFFACEILLKPDIKTEIVETTRTETDTIQVIIRDTVEIPRDRIVTEYLRDTVIKNVPINLSRFKGMEPLTYGNIHYSGIVAGEVIKIGFTTDFDIPQVTNTIYETKTITRTIEPKGNLYVGGFVSSGFTVAPAISYQAKGWQIGYSYELGTEKHRIGVMKGLF